MACVDNDMETEICRLFIDMNDESQIPAADDWLVTEGRKGFGSVYLIAESRRVKRKDVNAAPRFALRCFRGYALDDVRATQKRVWTLHWYPR